MGPHSRVRWPVRTAQGRKNQPKGDLRRLLEFSTMSNGCTSAAERVFGFRQATITRWLTRAGGHAHTLHERFFCHLHLPHLQLDELRTRLRCAKEVLWLWLVIDPTTKLLPVLHLGPRTQDAAHSVIHSLRHILAPGCLPLFTSDGLNMYFYALTAHFGDWLQEWRRGRNVRQWQVAAGLIYGQVKKSYRRRKLVRVTHVMRLGTEAALKAREASDGLLGPAQYGFYRTGESGGAPWRLSVGTPHLGHGEARSTPTRSPGMVASVLSFCASQRIAASGAHTAPRARWQTSSATLPAADASYGSGKDPPTVGNTGSPMLSFAASAMLHLMNGNDVRRRSGMWHGAAWWR